MKSKIATGIDSRPVTAMLVLLIGGFAGWIGGVLTLVDFPPARLKSFAGPLAFWDLHAWGVLFLTSCALTMLRFLLLWKRNIDFALHMLAMIPIIMWSISIDLGPASTGQPAYTFVTIVCFVSPFLTDIIQRGQVRNGKREVRDREAAADHHSMQFGGTDTFTARSTLTLRSPERYPLAPGSAPSAPYPAS